MPEGPSERRKKQNRDAQQTYRKSLLKRIEELEKRLNQDAVPDLLGTTAVLEPDGLDAMEGIAANATSDELQIPTAMHFNRSPIERPSVIMNAAQPPAHSGFEYPSFTNGITENTASYIHPSNNPTFFNPTAGTPMTCMPPRLQTEEVPPRALSHDGRLEKRKSSLTPRGTALHTAISSGNENIVKLLLERKADANALTQENKNALHLAVESGRCNIVRIILETGTNVNAIDGNGQTCLQKATAGGHEEMVRLLLDYGADVNWPIFYANPDQPTTLISRHQNFYPTPETAYQAFDQDSHSRGRSSSSPSPA